MAFSFMMSPDDISGTAGDVKENAVAMAIIFASGLILGLTYYVIFQLQTALEGVNCPINNNVYYSSCQEWFSSTVFPILNLKYLIIYFNYFAIFGLVLGMFYIGFRSRRHPVFFVVHVILSSILGYLSIELANVYRTLLSNPIFVEIITPFPLYHAIMMRFPSFMFTIIFVSGLIGLIGIFKGPFKDVESVVM